MRSHFPFRYPLSLLQSPWSLAIRPTFCSQIHRTWFLHSAFLSTYFLYTSVSQCASFKKRFFVLLFVWGKKSQCCFKKRFLALLFVWGYKCKVNAQELCKASIHRTHYHLFHELCKASIQYTHYNVFSSSLCARSNFAFSSRLRILNSQRALFSIKLSSPLGLSQGFSTYTFSLLCNRLG